MKKHIANIITGCRILCSLPLLFIPLSSAWFYVIYIFCGLTDMVDGIIARKTGSVSKFGARLDTIADFVFLIVCSIKILPIIHIPIWLWVWIILVAIIKMCNVVWGFIRKKKLVALHTVLNKTTGFVMFLLPLTTAFIEPTYSFAAACTIATIAAISEGYYIAKGKDIV